VTGKGGVVALIPARAGSKRILGKNLRQLAGHPLIAYSIAAAREADVFSRIIVSTEDEQTADAARHYGADVPVLRPAEFAHDGSPDIDWIRHILGVLRENGSAPTEFAILRPTSPLRRAQTIAAAVAALLDDRLADSIRAVEPVRQHPGKMWVLSPERDRMTPLLDDGGADPPWHSSASQRLPEVFAQNASLEVARVSTVDRHGTIAGTVIRPWLSEGFDGYDLNEETDWTLLESLLASGAAALPAVPTSPWNP
jgi:CMP-N,N'-diacetyllegionaminic acid synthase